MNLGLFPGFGPLDSESTEARRLRIEFEDKTARYLTANDVDTVIYFRAATAITVTLAIDPLLPVQPGDAIHLAQWGAGQVILSAASGINIYVAGVAKTRAQRSVISLLKVEPNVWHLFGDFAVA